MLLRDETNLLHCMEATWLDAAIELQILNTYSILMFQKLSDKFLTPCLILDLKYHFRLHKYDLNNLHILYFLIYIIL